MAALAPCCVRRSSWRSVKSHGGSLWRCRQCSTAHTCIIIRWLILVATASCSCSLETAGVEKQQTCPYTSQADAAAGQGQADCPPRGARVRKCTAAAAACGCTSTAAPRQDGGRCPGKPYEPEAAQYVVNLPALRRLLQPADGRAKVRCDPTQCTPAVLQQIWLGCSRQCAA